MRDLVCVICLSERGRANGGPLVELSTVTVRTLDGEAWHHWYCPRCRTSESRNDSVLPLLVRP